MVNGFIGGIPQADRPAIFISHSSKPRELPGDERLRYARAVLQLIHDALRAAGFQPWVDKDRLSPGDGWNAEIHAMLHTCAGAVILLDPVVLKESDWVLAEATVLAHRYKVSADFRLVPVLLGGAEPDDLQHGTWAPLGLAEIQAARENPSLVVKDMTRQPHDVAQQAASAFDGLAPATLDPLLVWWVKEIAVPLRTLAGTASHRLDAAAAALRMKRTDWRHDPRGVDRLAFALLDSGRDQIPPAVEKLAPFVNGRADPIGDQLAGKVTPLWVRLDTVSGVTRGLRREPAERRMLISTRDPDLASDIIHRAAYCSPEVRLARCTGEHGEDLDELVACYIESIAHALRRFDLLKTDSPDVIRQRLADANPPPFALIDCEGLNEEDITRLLDQLAGKFPGVVLVLLCPRSDIARTLPPPELSLVEPLITGDEERAATIFRNRILELAGD